MDGNIIRVHRCFFLKSEREDVSHISFSIFISRYDHIYVHIAYKAYNIKKIKILNNIKKYIRE